MVLLLACVGKEPVVSDSAQDSAVGTPAPANTVLVIDASLSMQEEVSALVVALQDHERQQDHQWAVMTVDGDKAGEFMREPSTDPGEALLAVACDAACWDASSLPSDPDYECGQPAEVVSPQFLDCACALDDWEGHCGSGDEEPLEAIYGALCRATDGCDEFTPQTGLLGVGVETRFAILTDEGDGSRRLETGVDSAGAYLDLYDATGQPYSISAMAPDVTEAGIDCNEGGATTWGVGRLEHAASASGGSFEPITDEDCGVGDVAGFLAGLM